MPRAVSTCAPRAARALAAASLLLVLGAAEPQGQPLPERVDCALPAMVDSLRGALQQGSPALRRYMQLHIKEAALSFPAGELRALFAAERDPAMLEALGAALATKASHSEDLSLVDPILDRARSEADPRLRAASLAGMRGTASVEVLQKKGGVSYEDFIRDPSPEVRTAAVDNLLHENDKVHFGHDRGVSEAAIKAAAASPDPATAARLLTGTSMEQVGPEAVQTLVSQLASRSPELRAAAAKALGGVPAASADTAQRALVSRYPAESEHAVRAAILEGLVHLRLSGAAPTLQSLRSVDPTLALEIDAWLKVLAMHLQEWTLILREKQRLAP
ncbi:HEAT repeat domain-containing protein [Chondromyces apiculatus]|uniref:HEAT repeat domain-containing protein n=1 Tax=Chondromyces apiculatus DSM 436 TaxID=1192034 RepID=A0A017T8V8_9BACT|nr:HEAT repeat domain-containing protein [Chondromyces apiculatus]EYF05250.1 Hypothetical protein CAP_3390 [Chondromyces apiculatus DSM 436]